MSLFLKFKGLKGQLTHHRELTLSLHVNFISEIAGKPFCWLLKCVRESHYESHYAQFFFIRLPRCIIGEKLRVKKSNMAGILGQYIINLVK